MSKIQKQVENFDLKIANAIAFKVLMDAFQAEVQDLPVEPMELANGWHTITPAMALELLKRNSRNRTVLFKQVCYYAAQMVSGMWRQTGQTIILTVDGELLDGQHRLWAIALSGVSIKVFIITDVPVVENLFAYIDNSRPRSARDALETAGLNGLSGHLVAAMKVEAQWETGLFGRKLKGTSLYITPMQYLQIASEDAELRDAIRMLYNEHPTVAKTLSPPDGILGALCVRIYKKCGVSMLDSFLSDFTRSDLSDNNAIDALRRYLEAAANAKGGPRSITGKELLQLLVKTFNFWATNKPIKKLVYDANEGPEEIYVLPLPQVAEEAA